MEKFIDTAVPGSTVSVFSLTRISETKPHLPAMPVGLLQGLPSSGLPRSNTYVLTPDGQRIAIFYTKLHNRLLRPLAAANDPPAPLPLRQALRVIDHHVTDYIAEARMPT